MLRIYRFPSPHTWQSLCKRPQQSLRELMPIVEPILDRVRSDGDSALREYSRQFDGVVPEDFKVAPHHLAAAGELLSEELRSAINTAAGTIAAFHGAQHTREGRGDVMLETYPGVVCRRVSRPIEKTGFYVPAGTAPLFSSVLMMAIPARVAGVPRRILCSPPLRPSAETAAWGDLPIHPAVLYAASVAQVHEIYCVGGAQAIAALAYGTETIPKVDKIFGPGNQYVTAAKQLVSLDAVAIDLPAGPSEIMVIADATAKPRYVAADLLSQAEHGSDSQVFFITTEAALLEEVIKELTVQLAALPRRDVAAKALENSVAVLISSIDEALALANEYAPEHLILATEHSSQLLDKVYAAGSVFLGQYTPESLGDYASGTNHILPTAGWARSWSGVSLSSFLRGITIQEATPQGLANIGPIVETLAHAEGLAAHANAVRVRLLDLPEYQQKLVRRGSVVRQTGETTIAIEILLDLSGEAVISTGIGFFDHMLHQIVRHSGIRAHIVVNGDLEVDEHHMIEDTAIALGSALSDALGDKRGIVRYAFLLPLDEALTHISLDLSGRTHLEWEGAFSREFVGDMPTEMVKHFFTSLCESLKCSLHVKFTGDNDHHKIETIFKSFGRVLGEAVRSTGRGDIPSTKGVL